MSSELRTVESDDVFCITLYRRFVLVDVHASIDERHMHLVDAAFTKLIRESQGREIGVLGLLRPDAPVPPAHPRQLAVHIVRTHRASIALIALVVEDGGAVARMFATVAHSINVLAGAEKLHLYEHLDAAAMALSTSVYGPARGADEWPLLRQAIDCARTHYRPPLGSTRSAR